MLIVCTLQDNKNGTSPLWCVLSCSVVSNSLGAPWTVAHQVPLSMGFPRKEYWSGLPFPSIQGIFLTLGSNPHLHWQADSLPLCHLGSQPQPCHNPLQISKPQTNPNWGWHSTKYLTNSSYICQDHEKQVRKETVTDRRSWGNKMIKWKRDPGLDFGTEKGY